MRGTALVLGGGGPVGGAWMTGVLAGLTEVGVDLVRADVIIGTSAGAIFGARLAAGETPGESYERQVTRADKVELRVTTSETLRFLCAALGSRDPERSLPRLGRAALAARTGPESELLRKECHAGTNPPGPHPRRPRSGRRSPSRLRGPA